MTDNEINTCKQYIDILEESIKHLERLGKSYETGLLKQRLIGATELRNALITIETQSR